MGLAPIKQGDIFEASDMIWICTAKGDGRIQGYAANRSSMHRTFKPRDVKAHWRKSKSK